MSDIKQKLIQQKEELLKKILADRVYEDGTFVKDIDTDLAKELRQAWFVINRAIKEVEGNNSQKVRR